MSDFAFYRAQAKDEARDLALYSALAARPGNPNREFFQALASQERRHLRFWASLAGAEPDSIKPGVIAVRAAVAATRLLGPTFTVRRLETQEQKTIGRYQHILESGVLDPQASSELAVIIEEERSHEKQIEEKFSDERVAYLGAAVLGLNDALVELTGGLTGLVSSIANTRLIGFTGLVIGMAAALSMAASNFLSEGMTTEQKGALRPGKAAAYTGIAYILVVVALVFPFFLVSGRLAALSWTWGVAIAVIAAFSYYSSVLQQTSFTKRFTQMLVLGLGVAVITFTVSRIASSILGISV